MIANQNLYYYTASTTGPTRNFLWCWLSQCDIAFRHIRLSALPYSEVEYAGISAWRIAVVKAI